MRAVLYGAAALAIATLWSPDALRSALATAASALIEATPFVFAGILLTRLLRRGHHALAYIGCGCTGGPSARSLPVAAATWLLFGPLVAIARYVAALLVARMLHRYIQRHPTNDEEPLPLLAELAAVFPAAILAGASAQFFAHLDPARLTPVANALVGATLGFAAAPCGLGAIALAGALRVHAPIAAAAFLCVAGVADLRALTVMRWPLRPNHDAFAYVLLAIALGIVAWRHGDALVHPAFSSVLWGCAAAALLCAALHRRRQYPAARIAPGLMLAGALIGAPPPAYHATETTLTDLFAGEHLRFTGTLTCDRRNCGLVRYAITCCRADAAPIAIRLDRAPRYSSGTWLRVDGLIDGSHDDLRLVAQKTEPIVPPSDPFVYR